METPPEFDHLQHGCDRYLDQNGHSAEAYDQVGRVLDRWAFMVTLATQRALSELFYDNLPDNVVPLQRTPKSPDFAS